MNTTKADGPPQLRRDSPAERPPTDCPRCGEPTRRVHRRTLDQLLARGQAVQRRQCTSTHCGWEGRMVIPGTPPPRPTKFIQVTRTLLIVIFVLALLAPPLIVWFILSGADNEPREDLIDFAPKQELQWPTR